MKISFKIKSKAQRKDGVCRLIVNEIPCQKKSTVRGACDKHYAYLKRFNLLEKYADIHHCMKVKTFSIKKDLKLKSNLNKCRLVVDGIPCQNKSKSRGVCTTHIVHLNTYNIFELYAVPTKRSALNIKVKQKAQRKKGICRLVVNGVPCKTKIMMRELCSTHRSYLRLHNLLDKYGAKSQTRYVKKITVIPKNQRDPDRCHLIINGNVCHSKKLIRGFCRKHYTLLYRLDLFTKFE